MNNKMCKDCMYWSEKSKHCETLRLCVSKSCFKEREKECVNNLYEYLPNTLEINTIEEMAELTQVISKIYRYGITDKTYINLIEELADVYLMLEIIKEKYKVDDQAIDVNMRFKLERLIQRIKEDKEGLL